MRVWEGEAARVYNGIGSTRGVFIAWKHPSIVIICLRMSACMCVCACGHGYICVSVPVLRLKYVCVSAQGHKWFPCKWNRALRLVGLQIMKPFSCFAPFSCTQTEAVTLPNLCKLGRQRTHLGAQVEPIFHSPPFKMYWESIWRDKCSLCCARQQEGVTLLCLSFPQVYLKCYHMLF